MASADVIFAQKATAIVKAAGMDPKAIDLETFRKWAPIIFSRAYSAIYKEQLISHVAEYSSKEEQILNSQLVIDGLTTKTRNPALATISGIDVYQGNHRAIGILVGILFAEGQRLWMEKMKNMQNQAQQQVAATSSNNNRHVSPSSPKRSNSNNTSPQREVRHDEDQDLYIDHENDDEEQMMGKLEKLYRSNQNISPRELEKLLNRIAYLENRLRSRSKKNRMESRRSRSRSNRKSGSPTNRRRNPRSGSPESQHLFDEDDGSDISETESVHADYEKRIKNHLDEIVKQKKVRPSSAPTTRRVKQVSSRLYSAPLNKNVVENNPALQQQQQQQHPSKPNDKPKPKPPPQYDDADPHAQYTYDLKSGRRILLSVAQLQMEERKKMMLAMGNVKAITKMEDELMGSPRNIANRNTNDPTSPPKPEYPGKRTEKSVQEWLEKMKKQLPKQEAPVETMPAPRNFALYQKLDKLDMVISIEHCHNCQHHNVSLRHDPLEYIKHADDFLKILGQVAFQSGLCVRLGVARFPASITSKSKTTDHDSRIGAFEIQIAFKSSSGELLMETIHSKLSSRRWPSKSVVEKRLTSFLSKTKAPAFYRSTDGDGDHDVTTESDGLQTYPGGRCIWEDTALSHPGWSFGSFLSSECGKSTKVQWVFDSRSLVDQPKFTAGATVWVDNLSYAAGCNEKYTLLGIVKQYDAHSNPKARKLTIRLKYTNDEIEVAESDCIGLKEYGSNGSNSNHTTIEKQKLPFDLESVLMLARAENCIAWKIMDDDDFHNQETNEMLLCRSSYFRQIRALVWTVIVRYRAKGIMALTHPLIGRVFDPYNNYSESMLDALISTYGEDNLLNVTKLMTMLPKPKEAPTPVVATPSTITPASVRSTTSTIPTPSSSAVTTNTASTADQEGSMVASKPSSTKPAISRPSILVKKPTMEDVDKIFPEFIENVKREGIAEKFEVVKVFKTELKNKAVRADDGILYLAVEQFILLLHDFNLEVIADNGIYLKSLSSYFSSSDAVGSALGLKVEEFCAWIDKNNRSSAPNSRKTSPRPEPSAQKSPRPEAPQPSEASVNEKEIVKQSPRPEPATQPSPRVVNQSPRGGNESGPVNAVEPAKEPAPIESTETQAVETNKENVEVPAKLPTPKVSPRPNQDVVSSPRPATVAETSENSQSSNENKVPESQSPRATSEAQESKVTEDPKPVVSSEPAPAPVAEAAVKAVSPRENAEEKPAIRTLSSLSPRVVKNYQNKDLVISSIIMEGTVLEQDVYDSVYIMVEMEGRQFDATVCLAREKGSKRRSYNVNWGEIGVSIRGFQEMFAVVTVLVADETTIANHPNFPCLKNTVRGVSKNSTKVQLSEFYDSSFEIKCNVILPSLVSDNDGKVQITFHGHAHEAKEARNTRILSMKPSDLLTLKFEPLPVDDYDENSDMSDEEILPKKSTKKGLGKGTAGGASSNDLNATLFPAPSFHNLLSGSVLSSSGEFSTK